MRVTFAAPKGTQPAEPPQAARRRDLVRRMSDLYTRWGYQPVDLPALEIYDADHPKADQAFTLTDPAGGLLSLRSDFTPAVARYVAAQQAASGGPHAREPVRLQVSGSVWQAIHPDVGRTREFHQVGVELVGVSHERADAELVHLARETIRLTGLTPRVELGSPGLLTALMVEAGVPEDAREALAFAIDRKDVADVARQLRAAGVSGVAADGLLAMPDLYGPVEQLNDAERFATGDASRAQLRHLRGVIDAFDDASELLLDLGMARRHTYYTGVTFRAYTPDFGQPLLGGGRYDGALLPFAAGFSLSLERLERALGAPEAGPYVDGVVVNDAAAERLRAAGYRVARSIATEPAPLRAEAERLGAQWCVVNGNVEPLTAGVDVSAIVSIVQGNGA